MDANGQHVDQDMKKAVHHWEIASIVGHPGARYCLGANEHTNCLNIERSMKHSLIVAKMGHNESLETLKLEYKQVYVPKEDFESALRAYHDAVDSRKSQRRAVGKCN